MLIHDNVSDMNWIKQLLGKLKQDASVIKLTLLWGVSENEISFTE